MKMTAKATVDSVRLEMISDMDIKYPKSKVEQNQISSFLSNIDSLITLHQRKHEKLINVKKALLDKMFPKNGELVPQLRFKGFTDTWEQRKLSDVVVSHNAGIYISKDKYGEGTNIIGVGDIYNGDVVNGEIYRLAPVKDDKFLLNKDNLIYGES
jgi:type I restriction enzyme S subunit